MNDRMRQMSGQELGNKLLESVKEMKAGRAARVTKVAPNQVAGIQQAQNTLAKGAGKDFETVVEELRTKIRSYNR